MALTMPGNAMEWSKTQKAPLVVGFEIHVGKTEFSVARLQSRFGNQSANLVANIQAHITGGRLFKAKKFKAGSPVVRAANHGIRLGSYVLHTCGRGVKSRQPHVQQISSTKQTIFPH